MDSNRRSFLKKAGAAAVAVSAAPLGLGVASAAEAAETRPIGRSPFRDVQAARPFGAGKFALELDGVIVGVLDDADGGRPFGDVIEVRNGGDPIARKHIAGVKYEDITLTTGFGMSPAFYDWIKGM